MLYPTCAVNPKPSHAVKALQIVEPERIEIVDAPMPEPGPGQARVKVLAVTTCPHWDMRILGGQPMLPGLELTYPYAVGQPGHEACGEVVAVGEGVTDLAPGQRVCVWRDPGHGRPGCYAQYVVKDAADLIAIPDDAVPEEWAPLELAMCVGAHMLLVEKLDFVARRRVAVFGLGPSGLLFVQFLRAAGADEIIGIDPEPDRRALAGKLGATRTFAPDDPEAGELPPRLQPGSLDTAIDCVGAPALVERAMDLTSRLVVLFAVQRSPFAFSPAHWGRLIVAGAQDHTRAAAEYARQRIAAGQVTLAPLVSARMTLDRYAEAVEMLRSRRALKVAFLPQDSG